MGKQGGGRLAQDNCCRDCELDAGVNQRCPAKVDFKCCGHQSKIICSVFVCGRCAYFKKKQKKEINHEESA